ncbi:MBL fold metallo-hydrolase [Aliikangiella sp. G2MR2-5]|uniref:MBL fold metallo-hydrolase n=1 Tax=Aliikangiella sp. G2MR2-5 TaxID=2788943 RepID=UPI0018AA05F2|nr:MBL fold metallo-hydrolase [Aliikangiella sp. G2MR2-5]
MLRRATILYQDDNHQCLAFGDLVKGEGIQSNQFLIVDNHRAALIDPGGDLTFAPLTVEINKHSSLESIDYIFASHQDPDIIASLPKWLMKSSARVITSRLWSRFLPHLVPGYMNQQSGMDLKQRVIGVDDKGGSFRLGDNEIHIIPAHFLHSVGNFHFFDPVSRILFSGDMGASLIDDGDIGKPVTDFKAHIPSMKGFHQRYMTSGKACRLWASMVRSLNVSMIVPQHGRAFQGESINQFLNWISELPCGVDLIDDTYYFPKIEKAAGFY